MKFIFPFILLNISCILLTNAHKCTHDKLKNIPLRQMPSSSKSLPFGYKQTTSTPFQNIRIHADYSSLTEGSLEVKEYIKNQLVPSAISFFSSALKVRRLDEPLTVDFPCSDLSPPPSLATDGVDADLIILVTAHPFDESFVAAALPCGLLSDYRPGYGAIYFNLRYLEVGTAASLEENLSTTLHEMTHVLGFASYMYDYFINPSTGKFLTGHVKTKVINGQPVPLIDLPPLTSRLRSYFGCSTLEGAFLENAGSEGSAGSHFERRVFMNEFMTASTITDPVVSEFTLAFLEGTGWYQVDYTKAEPFSWGKNEGCSFLNGPCLDSNAQPLFDEFCTPLSRIGCSFSARSVAICGTVGTITPDPTVSPANDYWHNNTAVVDPFADNCPYYIGFSFADCENPDNQQNAFVSQETYGITSRCYGGTLSTRTSNGRHLGYCFPTTCIPVTGGYSLKLTVGDTMITCTQEGMINVEGLLGYLECPDPNDFCEKADPRYCERGCTGRGTCTNKQCVCPKGWGGADCGLRVYVNSCDRCKGNGENTACFGDGCWCNPATNSCSGPTLIGSGGAYTTTPDKTVPDRTSPGGDTSMRKVGIIIWIIICIIVLCWKTKLGRSIGFR